MKISCPGQKTATQATLRNCWIGQPELDATLLQN